MRISVEATRNGSASTDRRRERFPLAMLVGHLAAAYAFIGSTLLLAGLGDVISGERSHLPTAAGFLEGVLAFPVVTLLLSVFAAFAMAPFGLLGLPAAWYVIVRRGCGAWPTTAFGALTGLVMGILFLSGILDAPADRGNPWAAGWGMPLGTFAASSLAGAVYARVAWSMVNAVRGWPRWR